MDSVGVFSAEYAVADRGPIHFRQHRRPRNESFKYLHTGILSDPHSHKKNLEERPSAIRNSRGCFQSSVGRPSETKTTVGLKAREGMTVLSSINPFASENAAPIAVQLSAVMSDHSTDDAEVGGRCSIARSPKTMIETRNPVSILSSAANDAIIFLTASLRI